MYTADRVAEARAILRGWSIGDKCTPVNKVHPHYTHHGRVIGLRESEVQRGVLVIGLIEVEIGGKRIWAPATAWQHS